MSNYLLILEYDGAGFHGWQKQPDCRSVQTELEKAAKKALRCTVKVIGAARTDAGVHASGQAANIISDKQFEPYKLVDALNSLLPKDISVVSAKKVPEDFNARFDAKEKTYTYRIWNRRVRSVWAQKSSWHIPTPLDMKKLKRSAKNLIGRHDYTAFAASGGMQENKTLKLRQIDIVEKDGLILLRYTADRFLYHMIRLVTGALVEAGRGRIKPEKIKEALMNGKRDFLLTTAPARGLTLERVRF